MVNYNKLEKCLEDVTISGNRSFYGDLGAIQKCAKRAKVPNIKEVKEQASPFEACTEAISGKSGIRDFPFCHRNFQLHRDEELDPPESKGMLEALAGFIKRITGSLEECLLESEKTIDGVENCANQYGKKESYTGYLSGAINPQRACNIVANIEGINKGVCADF